MVSLEFFPEEALGTIMLDLHLMADDIKRPPEVGTLLLNRDNHSWAVKRILDWPTEQ